MITILSMAFPNHKVLRGMADVRWLLWVAVAFAVVLFADMQLPIKGYAMAHFTLLPLIALTTSSRTFSNVEYIKNQLDVKLDRVYLYALSANLIYIAISFLLLFIGYTIADVYMEWHLFFYKWSILLQIWLISIPLIFIKKIANWCAGTFIAAVAILSYIFIMKQLLNNNVANKYLLLLSIGITIAVTIISAMLSRRFTRNVYKERKQGEAAMH